MPYTMGLLGAIPRIDASGKQPLVPIEGSPPSLADLPQGCPFLPRCPLAIDVCGEIEPPLALVGHSAQLAACHRATEIAAKSMNAGDVYPVPDAPPPVLATVPRAERDVVLRADNLVKHHPLLKGAVFKRQIGTVRAVDGISFEIREGETLGLVGESGCGKTTTLLQVLELTRPQEGSIVVLGSNTSTADARERQRLRRDLSVVFQDPLASLDPRMPVSDILAEPLDAAGTPKAKIAPRIRELLDLVGLEPSHAGRYPQQFSGGQRQRVAIARALALEPKLLVLDEPVSALDVSIQAGVVNLLDELKSRLRLSYLFVGHDLSVVRHIADRVAVMYLGKIVEIGDVERVYVAPSHPYTQALLSAIPIPDPQKERQRRRILLEGDLPSPANPPAGCRFHTRCPKFAALGDEARRPCLDQEPPLHEVAVDQESACHYAERVQVV
jgi:peptide/nickel transport system ATP-binding protein